MLLTRGLLFLENKQNNVLILLIRIAGREHLTRLLLEREGETRGRLFGVTSAYSSSERQVGFRLLEESIRSVVLIVLNRYIV